MKTTTRTLTGSLYHLCNGIIQRTPGAPYLLSFCLSISSCILIFINKINHGFGFNFHFFALKRLDLQSEFVFQADSNSTFYSDHFSCVKHSDYYPCHNSAGNKSRTLNKGLLFKLNNTQKKLVHAQYFKALGNNGKAIKLKCFSMKVFSNLKLVTMMLLYTLTTSVTLNAATEVISTGSFIINMGVSPQTFANGLKPYGMVYDLVKNSKVPIKWVINSSKIKDGIDFSHNGIDYRGGAFIVPSQYRNSAVNARITYWQGQGVVGATTVSPISVDVYTTIKVMPIWTLDDQNGTIAQGFLQNAGIPSTAYNWLAPASLNCCNDLFIMPHADPKWPTHGNLYTWNLDCDGAIWLGCHAGSALEDLFNPSNKPQQMNFLSNKTGNATGAGPYEENALILWGNHSNGSLPYNYAYPTDPIMQFLGILDAATQNGSEQIFLPKVSWRAGAKVYVWDPSHVDVPSKSPGPAAIVVSGRAFDDPSRGRVMLEAAHSINKASAPANVAAQRTFFNFSYLNGIEKAVIPSLGAIPDTMYSDVGYTFSFTLPPGYNPSDYIIAWSSDCGGNFSPANQAITTYTPPVLTFPTTCILYVTITDACGREFSNSKIVVAGCNLQVAASLTSPKCKGSSNGSIGLTITVGNAPYTWNWTRISPSGTGSGNGAMISGLSVGIYNITVSSNGGCTKTLAVNLTEPSLLSVSSQVTNVLCNGASTGAITVSVTGGTPTYSFNWGGGVTTQNRINIPAGTYIVTVTDVNGCTTSASATVTQAPAMSIIPTPVNIACLGDNTDTINLTVTGGTGAKIYNWSNGSSSQNITGVAAGTYTVTITDANGCTRTSSATVTQPAAALGLSATTINVSCNGGNKGSIDLTVTGGTSPFTYSWSNGPTTQDITGLIAGIYSVTVTDANLCTSLLSITITQPSVLSLNVNIINATCPDGANGSIDLTVSGGSSPYTYDWDNDGLEFPYNDTQDLTGILPGTYTVIVADSNGCTASILAIVNATKNFPSAPTMINH